MNIKKINFIATLRLRVNPMSHFFLFNFATALKDKLKKSNSLQKLTEIKNKLLVLCF